ncbi:MAG TPA: undecaprenyldiphospho-muramoylpentapeptide beta-N-acetylglucosaminyltransferase [Chitinophagales bacterium]|nr:undecaprenyldiphospho-muramoylpentapeptide beta-N-acetylglucosaminyltransferase [Chitinophagales bacterium]
MQRLLKVIISGGGTGGHIFPAVSIANAIRKIEPAAEILFIGALGKMEMEKVPRAGYKIVGLPIAGLQRSASVKNLSLPFKVVNSLMKAVSIVRSFKPGVVVGVGGYASGPVLFAAGLMGIPTLIQEQNSYAGITNKILARRAKKICVAYEGMEAFFPAKKITVTGNPVRKDILDIEGKRLEGLQYFNLHPNRKTILVIGGSLGARTINQSIAAHLNKLVNENVQVLWQTGKSYFESNAAAAKGFEEKIVVREFIDRMDLAYAVADIVISRAGALSIAELCVTKKPCVLVPSPNVAEDHQTKNAMALVVKDAALLVKDAEAKEKLVDITLQLLKDKMLQQKLSGNISMFARPHADNDIAREVIKLTHT